MNDRKENDSEKTGGDRILDVLGKAADQVVGAIKEELCPTCPERNECKAFKGDAGAEKGEEKEKGKTEDKTEDKQDGAGEIAKVRDLARGAKLLVEVVRHHHKEWKGIGERFGIQMPHMMKLQIVIEGGTCDVVEGIADSFLGKE